MQQPACRVIWPQKTIVVYAREQRAFSVLIYPYAAAIPLASRKRTQRMQKINVGIDFNSI
jgi:hypothetical protein